VEVGDPETDRISLNQKDSQKDEDAELSFNQVKNFHTLKKAQSPVGGAITGIAGLQEELPEDMKQ
jgi:hypothetical protein